MGMCGPERMRLPRFYDDWDDDWEDDDDDDDDQMRPIDIYLRDMRRMRRRPGGFGMMGIGSPMGMGFGVGPPMPMGMGMGPPMGMGMGMGLGMGGFRM